MTTPDDTSATTSGQPEPAVSRSRYRCRTHPDFAVSARGRGCLACRREPKRRRVVVNTPNDGLAKVLRDFDTQRG